MDIAQLVSERSTCLRRKVGAVLVRERRILCTGYNGAARGLPHCDEVGCLREKLHIPSGELIENGNRNLRGCMGEPKVWYG